MVLATIFGSVLPKSFLKAFSRAGSSVTSLTFFRISPFTTVFHILSVSASACSFLESAVKLCTTLVIIITSLLFRTSASTESLDRQPSEHSAVFLVARPDNVCNSNFFSSSARSSLETRSLLRRASRWSVHFHIAPLFEGTRQLR